MHRKRQVVLRHTTGAGRDRDAVDARRRGCRRVGGGAAADGPASDRSGPGRSLDHGHRSGRAVRQWRRGLRGRAPAVPGLEGAGGRPARVEGQRAGSAARSRLPDPAGASGMGRHRQHQVARLARGVDHRADVAMEHDLVPDDRRLLPDRHPSSDRQPGPLGVRARLGSAVGPASGGHRDRARVERGRSDRLRRRQLRQWSAPGAARSHGASVAVAGPSSATTGTDRRSATTC